MVGCISRSRYYVFGCWFRVKQYCKKITTANRISREEWCYKISTVYHLCISRRRCSFNRIETFIDVGLIPLFMGGGSKQRAKGSPFLGERPSFANEKKRDRT